VAVDGGERLQHLGVAGVVDAGRMQRFLVDRRGDDGGDIAAQRELGGLPDAGRSRGAGARIDVAERRLQQVGRKIARLLDAVSVGRRLVRIEG
jgi:hypothetical protein